MNRQFFYETVNIETKICLVFFLVPCLPLFKMMAEHFSCPEWNQNLESMDAGEAMEAILNINWHDDISQNVIIFAQTDKLIF